MNNEYEPDLIVLLDDDGEEHSFEILDAIEHEGETYYALAPASDDPADILEGEGEYYIFRVVEVDGEEQLEEVEDEVLRDQLDQIFTERFDSLFDDDYKDFSDV
ncbi:MAG: DUF1292 domain-containing protein [Clostridia bacterium]|nr:DUF1292 domain-containing protein [Clostridia bacterium]